MNPDKLLACLVIASAVLGASTAWATPTTTFETRIENVTFGVLDLTPGDGIDAYQTSTFSYSHYYALLYRSGDDYHYVGDLSSGAQPVDYAFTIDDASVRTYATGTPGELGIQGTIPHSLGPQGYVRASAVQYYTVELGAYSALTVSGHLRQFLQSAQHKVISLPTSELQIRFSSSASPSSGGFDRVVTPTMPGTSLLDEDFLLTYANPTSESLSLSVRFFASASAPVPTVPEPSTYLMLGSGLLAIGVLARRRARNT